MSSTVDKVAAHHQTINVFYARNMEWCTRTHHTIQKYHLQRSHDVAVLILNIYILKRTRHVMHPQAHTRRILLSNSIT